MANVSGKECDGCNKIFHRENAPADFRIEVRIFTKEDHKEGIKDFCSDACHHKWTVARRKATDPKYAQRIDYASRYSQERQEAERQRLGGKDNA